MSTLYIRHPSKASTESVPTGSSQACPFALVSDSGAIERQGLAALATMAGMIDEAQRVVLLLAGSDVSLLRVKVPLLSAAKLKAALPNLVEDQLISDPSECVVVAAVRSETADGLTSVAVVQRVWLTYLVENLQTLGARKIVALPAQLCLPYQDDAVSVAVGEQDMEADPGIDLTLRLSLQEGIGIPVLPEHPDSIAHDVMLTLRTLVPEAALNVYVPQAQLQQYQDKATAGVTVHADSWQRWIAGARGASLDLMAGMSAGGTPDFDWNRWRWPLILASLVALVHIGSLNFEWLRSKREADGLKATMEQTYKSVYPKEAVILDPIAQMKQKIAAGKTAAGQAAPGDFAVLAAAFGDAWNSVTQNRKAPGIAGLDYKERSLQVRLKPEGDAPLAEMKAALAARNLVLAATAADVWQIRSGK